MTGILALENILLSVLVNGIGLVVAIFSKSAPPRLVLYTCLVSMLAIIVPWSSIGLGFRTYLPVDITGRVELSNPAELAAVHEVSHDLLRRSVLTIWFVIGLGWIAVSFLRFTLTIRKWRGSASPGQSLAEYADRTFANELRRSRIHRLPRSSQVFASGVWHPDIWVGDEIRSDTQIQVALNHELSHIASNDQLTLLVVAVIERLLWWNPFIWFLGRQARRQMEYACDSRCQLLIGATQYRQTLAELFLSHHDRNVSLEVGLGSGSDLITRMEKIGMTHSLKLKHITALAFGCALAASASSILAVQNDNGSSTLIQCHELLPADVQYDFRITSAIDTREGANGELNVTLIDPSMPESNDIPDGAGDFLRCVQKIVGVGNDEGWPGT